MKMTEQKKTYKNIDALRAFGCLAIIFWHIFANSNYEWRGIIPERIIPSFDYLVYLFMLISGFGMCNGYYKKVHDGELDVNRFYIRRYKKTLPFFALVVLLDCLMSFSMETLYEAFTEITMLFGFLPNNNLSVIGVSWTLGVIFVFYIIFPYFVFLIYDKKRAWISLIVSLAITYMCQIYFMTDKFVVQGYPMRHSFLYCIPFFVMGGLIYLYKEDIEKFVNNNTVPAVGACLLLTVSYFLIPNRLQNTDIVAFKCLVVYAAWLCVALGSENKLLSNRFTALISGISMEMYLSHMIAFRVLEKIQITSMLGNSVLGYILTSLIVIALLVAGILGYQKVTEKLFSRLRRVR